VIILEYHRVNPEGRGELSVRTDAFRGQLRYLLDRGYNNVSLDEVANRLHGPVMPLERSFAITFDDGYRDNYSHAMPVLEELGLKATVFLTVNYIGTERLFHWDIPQVKEWGGPTEEDLPLSWDHVDKMLESGIFSVGSHTLSHPLLTEVDPATAKEEIISSRLVLEQKLGRPIVSFCPPAGDLNRDTISYMREAGYRLGVVTPQRSLPITRYTLRRVGLYRTTDMNGFKKRVGFPFQFLLQSGLWPGVGQLRRKRAGNKLGTHPSSD
jgi:peptidoglycan/xylan/chitin deacetylase (PgdA/CDA1 family)